ncbi:hypothetical protein B0H13DRAFT_1850697 [Mycena leptocephala]|nr:hypothetical protein B0H13DRAFT_1850697 [Mycena leptocephala]
MRRVVDREGYCRIWADFGIAEESKRESWVGLGTLSKPASAAHQSSKSMRSSMGSPMADQVDANVDSPPRARHSRTAYYELSYYELPDVDGREELPQPKVAPGKQEQKKPVKVSPPRKKRVRDPDPDCPQNDHGRPSPKFKEGDHGPPASKRLEMILEEEREDELKKGAADKDVRPSSDSGTCGSPSKKRRQEEHQRTTKAETLGRTMTRKRVKGSTETPSLAVKPKKRAPAKPSRPRLPETRHSDTRFESDTHL